MIFLTNSRPKTGICPIIQRMENNNQNLHYDTQQCPEETRFEPTGDCEELKKQEDVTETFLAWAVYDYFAKSDVELDLTRGDIIIVHSKTSESWWWGEKDECFGYIPVNHISTKPNNNNEDWQDEHYFEIYGNLQVHYEMLSDEPRTLTYLKAIRENAGSIAGKTVMDIGCGTGILSLFLARDGKAGEVIAIEASKSSKIAELIVKSNGQYNIRVIGKRVEEVELTDKVDLIISEWMGTLLVSEYMIESVILARDKFLKPGGKIWPSLARLYFAPCSAIGAFHSKFSFWDDVYGFNFSALRTIASNDLTKKPLHENISKEQDLLAEAAQIFVLHMNTVAVGDLEHIVYTFKFTVSKAGVFNGFCTWFSADFENLSDSKIDNIILDTGPSAQLTHWRHPFLLIASMADVLTGDLICGIVELKRNNEMRRHLTLTLHGEVIRCETVLLYFEKEFKCWE